MPHWSQAFTEAGRTAGAALPISDVWDWAIGGSTGAGVRVAVLDSGIDGDHPRVRGVAGAVDIVVDPGTAGEVQAIEGPHEDLVGHGTACAAIIRSLAPDVELYSVRVLGASLKGSGARLLAGIRWIADREFPVANLSLSTKSEAYLAALHTVCDQAYFARSLLVCAANNLPGPTYPTQFASVVSVAAMPGDDPWALAYNDRPPVEFGARGIDVNVAWTGGTSILATGNSLAAPHISAVIALIRAKHPDLAPFQVKSVLHALAHDRHL